MDKLHSGGHFLKWSHRTPRDACYFSVVSHLLDFFLAILCTRCDENAVFRNGLCSSHATLR